MTEEQRAQLEAIEKCDPSWLLMDIKQNSVFDAAVLEKVFDLAKDQARALLAASASAEPIYQVLEPCEALWSDVDWLTYESTDGAFRRIVYAAPTIEAPDNSQEIARLCRLFMDDESGKYNAKSMMLRIFGLAIAPSPVEAPAQAVALSAEQEPVAWVSEEQLNLLRLGTFVTAFAARDFKANVPLFDRAALSAPTSMSAEAVEIVKRIKDAAQHWGGWSGTAGQCDRLLELFAAPASMSAAPPAQSTPDGWKVVPVEPTPIMRKAAADAWLNCDSKMVLNKAAAAARAAISAAPSPEKQS